MGRIEYPADLGRPVLAIGEPERDIADRRAVVLQDQRYGPLLAVEVGARQTLVQNLCRASLGPRIVQQKACDVRPGVDRYHPIEIIGAMKSQAQPVGPQRQWEGHAATLTT